MEILSTLVVGEQAFSAIYITTASAYEAARHVRAVAARRGDLSLIPGTHMVKGEK